MQKQTKSLNSDLKARLIYSDTVRNADLLYLTGLLTEDPFLWFSVAGHEYVLISDLEIGRARRLIPETTTILGFSEARKKWGVNGGRLRIADYITGMTEFFEQNEWQVPGSFPLRLALALQEKGLNLVPVEDFCVRRSCKNAVEVDRIRLGIRMAEHGFFHAAEIIEESVINSQGYIEWHGDVLTAEHLRGEIQAEVGRSGGLAFRTIVATGIQAADPHEIGHGPMAANQPIVIDIFPRVETSGYHGDLTRTIVKGRPADIVRKAFTAVAAARQAGMAAIKAGVAARVPHEKAAAVLREHGFETGEKQGSPYGFFHGLGHGLGLELHESPRLSLNTETVLEAGNVVTVEPGLYYPEWGGVRLEDTVVVSEKGYDNLTVAPSFLEIP